MPKDDFDLLLGSILGIAGLGILAFLGLNKSTNTNVTTADSLPPPPSQNKESGCGCAHNKKSTG